MFAMNEFQIPSAITEKSVITLICLPSTKRTNKLNATDGQEQIFLRLQLKLLLHIFTLYGHKQSNSSNSQLSTNR